MKVEYKSEKGADTREIEVDIVLEDFTDEDIAAHAMANMVVKIQGRCRTHHAKIASGKKDKLPASKKEWVEFLKPQARLTIVDKAKKVLSGLTKEQILELLEQASEE